MRILRLISIAVGIGAVYWAQYALLQGALLPSLPAWAGLLQSSLQLVAEDISRLRRLTILVTLAGVILFLVAVPPWRGEIRRVYRALTANPHHSKNLVPPPTWQMYTLFLGSLLGLLTPFLLGDIGWSLAIWLGAIALFVFSLVIHNRFKPRTGFERDRRSPIFPYRSLAGLVLLLILTSIGFWYALPLVPVSLDAVTLAHAHALRTLAEDAGFLWQSENLTGASTQLFFVAPALPLYWWTGDPFYAGQIRGALSVLGLMLTTWLVACELFRRTPSRGRFGEPVEDDGALSALLAAASIPAFIMFYPLARVPWILDSVWLGLLSLWLLLLGARRRQLVLVGLSGLLAGMLLFSLPLGFAWMLLLLAAWLGIRLLNPAWLGGHRTVGEAGAPPILLEYGLGLNGVSLWLWGFALTSVPAIVHLFSGEMLAALWAGTGQTVSLNTFPIHILFGPEATGAAGSAALPALSQPLAIGPIATTLLHLPGMLTMPWLAPWILLAVILLTLHVDHLFGWLVTAGTGISLLPLLATGFHHALSPFWAALALPFLALAVALCLDRARSALLRGLGSWPIQATLYAAFGLLLATTAASAIRYIEVAGPQRTPESELARLLPALSQHDYWRIATQHEAGSWIQSPQSTAVLAAFGIQDERVTGRIVTFAQWPSSLSRTDALLISAQEPIVLQRLQAEFGRGHVTTLRNSHSNPVLYIYRAASPLGSTNGPGLHAQ